MQLPFRTLTTFTNDLEQQLGPVVAHLRQQHGQSHDEVLCQFVFIVNLSFPLLGRQNLDDETFEMKRGNKTKA